MGIRSDPEPTIDDLELSGRFRNALKGNYHGWYDGRSPEHYYDPCLLPPPPLSWLREVMAKPRMWRSLYHVGNKGHDEIEQALKAYDGGGRDG